MHFRIFATKNTANLANFDPTPTLTGVSNQKTSVFASEYTKNNSPKVVLKDTESEENNKKSNEIRKQQLDDVINNDNNVANIDNIGNSMNRHMQQIDHQTGEVVEGFVAYVVPKRKNGFQKGWMAMAQEA